VLREVVGHRLAGSAVVRGQALGATRGAGRGHCDVGLIVAGHGDAPVVAELSVVVGAVAGEAVSAGVAGVAIVGAGRACSVVVVLSGRTACASVQDALVALEVVAIAASAAVGGRGTSRTTGGAGRGNGLVVFVVAGQGDAPVSVELAVVGVGLAAEAVAVAVAGVAVEGAGGAHGRRGVVDAVAGDAGGAVGGRGAEQAVGWALAGHRNVGLVVAGQGDAPGTVEGSVVSTARAVHAVAVTVAVEAVEGAGLAAAQAGVVVESLCASSAAAEVTVETQSAGALVADRVVLAGHAAGHGGVAAQAVGVVEVLVVPAHAQAQGLEGGSVDVAVDQVADFASVVLENEVGGVHFGGVSVEIDVQFAQTEEAGTGAAGLSEVSGGDA
jgi:hypothetical protein